MMRMDEHGESFDQLRKLLALKKHEVPPPGYFDRFPAEVISGIRMEKHHAKSDAVFKLQLEAPWLIRFVGALAGKPIFAGAFGAAICSLVLAGVYLTNKPAAQTSRGPGQRIAPFAATSIDTVSSTVDKPLLGEVTNTVNDSALPSLFDLAPPLQVAPVSDQRSD